MARSTIITGNGLGKAIDPIYFDLELGLASIWNNQEIFSQEHKLLIIQAIEGATEEIPPREESQLDTLQLAIAATETLKKIDNSEERWLTETASSLPEAFRKFIHSAAMYFHNSQQTLPDQFIQSLAQNVRDNFSHIATLNYDNLLYDGLLREGVMRGYFAQLIDGYCQNFEADNLERYRPDEQCWYLHLHGSPLFVDNLKLAGTDRDQITPDSRSHIVLTHVDHKRTIIDTSPILKLYWEHLGLALDESDKIILFGYSGFDEHLNEKVRQFSDQTQLTVVEWEHAGDYEQRIDFWKKKTGFRDPSLHHLSNILDFVDW